MLYVMAVFVWFVGFLMGELKFGRDLGKFLYCSSLLEERIANAYEHIAELVGDRLIRGLLGFIACDSFKHAECFRMVGEWLSGIVEVYFEDCGEVWGETWKTLMTDAEKFLNRSAISSMELVSLIKGLMKLESFVAEEYLTVMHVKLVELMADEAKLDLENFRTLLEWIIEDEKRHEQILRMIEKVLAEKEK
jgi:hypothetical protein